MTHPVEDFLFTYYSFSPGALRRWHPGFGVGLRDGHAWASLGSYVCTGDVVHADPDRLMRRRPAVEHIRTLLAETAARPPQLGCLGLHEWAMVYRSSQVRHADRPLRLGSAGTDAVVEAAQLQCTHHDAFRFFTEPARPRNALQPRREDQPTLEQPGCLHATMDLYKWAYKLTPFVPSSLVVDCFELAREVRKLDMRASPYDLRDLGHEPVPIETPAGRAEYVRGQRAFAERAAPLRRRLIDECDRLLSWSSPPVP